MRAVVTIAQDVARLRGVPFGDLISSRRTRSAIQPRHEAFYLARELTTASLPQIAKRLGDRDHTTVLHGCRMIEARIRNDSGYAAEIAAMGEDIRGRLRQRVPYLVEPTSGTAEPTPVSVTTDMDDAEAQLVEALTRIAALEENLSASTAEVAALVKRAQTAEGDRDRLVEAERARANASPHRLLAAFKTFENEQFGRGETLAFNRLVEALIAFRASFKPGSQS